LERLVSGSTNQRALSALGFMFAGWDGGSAMAREPFTVKPARWVHPWVDRDAK
jgi:hypothetical protein